MSVLIKGIEMPKNCKRCPLRYTNTGYTFCELTGESLIIETDKRDDSCPLIEVPPHGDLVDRNYLISEYDRQHSGPAGGARRIIEDAPPIIEAEGSENENNNV